MQQNSLAMPQISHDQLTRLKHAHAELTSVLLSLGAIDNATPQAEPKWRADYAKMWRLLKAVELAGGDVGIGEWSRLGAEHGYDPRGLGGFFRGDAQMMAAETGTLGARRVLTDHGRRFIARWEPDFGPYER
jgi:hypothetical protein